ncbi:MAG: carbohydrate-binding family 9-like protein [Polyangiaceae bacterium]
MKTSGDGVALLSAPRPTHFKSMAPFAIHTDGAPQWAPQSRATSIVAPAAPATTGAAPATGASSATVTPPTGHAATTGPATSAASGGGAKREAHAMALGETRLTIDGRAEEAWQKAPALSFDTDYAGKPSGISTRVRFAWSKEALHALFELEGAGLATDRTRAVGVEREALYQEDCVEIFLGPDPATPKRYYEIELGPFGHFFDLDVNAGKPTIAWSSGARIAATQDAAKGQAVIEVSMSAADITRLLVPGARWPLGIYRIEGKGERKYLAWSPPRTSKPNFHVPEAFGVLVVDP